MPPPPLNPKASAHASTHTHRPPTHPPHRPSQAAPPPPHSELVQCLLLSIPTAFDLVATILMNVGLLYVTASVYQMMRGAEMLFAALFAAVFLRRKLNRFHLMGIGCCMVSACACAASSTSSTSWASAAAW